MSIDSGSRLVVKCLYPGTEYEDGIACKCRWCEYQTLMNMKRGEPTGADLYLNSALVQCWY